MANRKTIAQHTAVVAPEPALLAGKDHVHYPDSDGRFLPEDPIQARAIMNVRFALQHHFDRVANVVLEGDMFLYYEPGNPAASIAPDIIVVLDHDLGKRGVYKLWEEGKPPDFALEVISPSSEIRNSVEKVALYARLGIGEYFLFQPDIQKRGRRLVGYELLGQSYEEVAAEPDGALCSAKLGVSLRVEGTNLRLRSSESGREYAWIEENPRIIEAAHGEAATARAEAATARAQVEAEVEALRRLEVGYAELQALLRQRG